jgi:aryl-alcohol dehydrogenase-like predicted oxidoreductase
MKYRRLGRTDLRVSVVGIGTWQFGGEWGKTFTQTEVNQLLGRGRDLGINLIDTAECYGDHLSERLIGAAIEGRRENWIVATKFGHRFKEGFQRDQLWSAEQVREQLEASLRALRTDFIDLYQFHSGRDQAFDQKDLWQMLGEQVKAGKVRHLGISVGGANAYQVGQAKAVGASAIQVVYNRLDREPEEEVLPLCREQDLGVVARVPLASGFLTGKYKPGSQFANPRDVRSRRGHDQVQERLQQVLEIERTEVPPGVSMAPWALAWCLQHPAVTCVIPGCKTIEQVASNASAADLDLVRVDHPQALA